MTINQPSLRLKLKVYGNKNNIQSSGRFQEKKTAISTNSLTNMQDISIMKLSSVNKQAEHTNDEQSPGLKLNEIDVSP